MITTFGVEKWYNMRIELDNFMRYIQRNNIKDVKAKGLIQVDRLLFV